MSITVDNIDGAHGGSSPFTISLGERFDFAEVENFRKCYESLANVDGKTLVIDFAKTRYIDSSALGMLINAKRYFDSREVSIRLVKTNEQVRKIFAISRFETKFEIS